MARLVSVPATGPTRPGAVTSQLNPSCQWARDSMGIKRWVVDRMADATAAVLWLGKDQAYRYFLDALWERYPGTASSGDALDIQLFHPVPQAPDPADRKLVERIFTAYGRASLAQSGADARYLPSPMWQHILATSYADVTESLAERDIDRFHRFLVNFGRWPNATGIEESRLIRQCLADRNKRRHLFEKIVAPLVEWWLRLESDGRDLSALEIPRHGNLGAVLVNGHLISPGSIFSEIHSRLLAGFLQTGRPVIGELGGGFGRLFYFLSRQLRQFCYVGFDLPETLCCASYYLMKTFPDKRFLLYGEQDWDGRSLKEYDFLLLPSFEIARLPDASIDLFVTENSLGEMEAAACGNYVTEICRSSQSFWHRNHEHRRFTFADNTTSLLNKEYPVPAEQFAQIARYCDVGPLVRADRMHRDSDMFWYYYRRRAATAPGRPLDSASEAPGPADR